MIEIKNKKTECTVVSSDGAYHVFRYVAKIELHGPMVMIELEEPGEGALFCEPRSLVIKNMKGE